MPSSGYYLLDNPNPYGQHYRLTRRRCQHGHTRPHLIVVHTAENKPDFDPPDIGAEAVARYFATTPREVSAHATVDSDSVIWLLPDGYEAWHAGTSIPGAYNSCSVGVEIATKAASWYGSPDRWRYAVLDELSSVLAVWARRHRIDVRHIMKEDANKGMSGLIGHGELDPDRRTDPGAAFPWAYVISETGAKMVDPTANNPQPADLVRAIQRSLNTAGATPKLVVDGIWGPLTEAAFVAAIKSGVPAHSHTGQVTVT